MIFIRALRSGAAKFISANDRVLRSLSVVAGRNFGGWAEQVGEHRLSLFVTKSFWGVNHHYISRSMAELLLVSVKTLSVLEIFDETSSLEAPRARLPDPSALY